MTRLARMSHSVLCPVCSGSSINLFGKVCHCRNGRVPCGGDGTGRDPDCEACMVEQRLEADALAGDEVRGA